MNNFLIEVIPVSHEMFEQLADGLSKNNYAVVPDFLTDAEARAILDILIACEQEGEMKKAGIGGPDERRVNQEIRGDKIRWIDPSSALPPAQVYISRIRELMQFINRSCFLGLKDFELHYTFYPKGTFYKRHLDQFKHNDHRRLSFICYLNLNWQPSHGGQLRLYLPVEGTERSEDIAPTAGKLAVFRSDLLEHEVLPVEVERYSLTGWMLDQLNELTFLG